MIIKMIHKLFDELYEESFQWLCDSRTPYPSEQDIWDLRWRWQEEHPRIRDEFLSGAYRFGARRWVTLSTGRDAEVTSARDALAIKALTLVLERALLPRLSRRCFHLKGVGGVKAAAREAMAALEENDFVFKTDVKAYYDSIDHGVLLDRLQHFLHHETDENDLPLSRRVIANYVGQFMFRITERDGLYEEVRRGVPAGASLSPLLGAFYLREADRKAEALPVCYIRFMDDILVTAKKRWRLKKAVKIIKRELAALNLEIRPEKTFIGRKEKGFDFLGYHFSPGEITISEKTLRNFLRKSNLIRMQEPPETREGRLNDYTLRWIRWAKAGLK